MKTEEIIESMKKFFICTQLPIIAIKKDTTIINSCGYNDYFFELLNDNNIITNALNRISFIDNNFEFITCTNDIYFSIFLINENNYNDGIYILGPHSCIDNNNIPYKPICVIKHLITLFRNLNSSIDECIQYKNHSFHIEKTMNYLEKNYYKDIKLSDVAKYLNINKIYFCNLLKKETNKTFTSILNEIRIEKSKELLLKNDLSILDIALASGFKNQSYYNVVFKKICGISPSEYMKNKI